MTTTHDSPACCTPSYATDRGAEADHSALADCCSPGETATPDEITALDEIKSEEADLDVAAIRSAAFRALLHDGEPVTVDHLVAATAVPTERVAEIYETAQRRGRVEFDDHGRLIGIAGLSLTPSRHELTIGGKTRWTWCALDAIGILGALRATGTVKSSDPQTSETIEIPFEEGSPTADAHLFILGGFSEGNVREDWCPRVNFFTSRHAAEAWVKAADMEGDIVSVGDIAAEAAEMWTPVVNLEADQIC